MCRSRLQRLGQRAAAGAAVARNRLRLTLVNGRPGPPAHAAVDTGAQHGPAARPPLVLDLGAIVLGAGLALLAPDVLRGYAIPILVAGILVHGTGLSLKQRLEAAERDPLWWERALFWFCWACLGLLAAWLLVRLFTT